ncbi:hypothetical protein BS47DRAFT_1363001 [Hydnum rufescens UP504]|uniref:Uncharacterized protein n=1 Tax=Hydnum rufescens UP504 TaxID=1448309 RepID=A0A9P6DVI9_9AGAM|nr:hypothetical protein BS47DRAFT_1363001 [Hydnum rufescens UP504]
MGTSISITDEDVAPNMNFVKVGRKPTDEEVDEIQRRCNEVIPRNVRITVDTPEDAKTDSFPSDYDAEKGVVRVIKIEGTNTRLYFAAGARAVRPSTLTTHTLRSISSLLSTNPAHPSEVIQRVDKLNGQVRDMGRAGRKLENEIAGYEAARVIGELDGGLRAAFVLPCVRDWGGFHRGRDGCEGGGKGKRWQKKIAQRDWSAQDFG